MAQVQQRQSYVSPWVILGLSSESAKAEIESAYRRLASAFADDGLMSSPQSWVQAQQAIMAIEDAYKRACAGEEDRGNSAGVELPPKLGQMLVASGKISLEQLEEALAQQAKFDLPLGDILKSASLITQMELDNFLLNQRLIKLPADSPHHFGQRLIGLGLVTEDMVRIALVEQRTTGTPIGQILVSRLWLSSDILETLVTADRAQCV